MEEITLIGNLGSDPDVRYTNGGEKVVSFSLAVPGGEERPGGSAGALVHLRRLGTGWRTSASSTCARGARCLCGDCPGRRPIRASGTGSPGRP